MININSWIIPLFTAIIGAIVTVIVSTIISSHTEKNKIKHEEMNTKSNLKVEFELNKKNLEEYNEKYLKQNLSTIIFLDKDKTTNYSDFYKNLGSFPIFNHIAWNNAQNIINNIFNEREIKEMREFNTTCDKLKEKANNLHKKYDNELLKKENYDLSDIRDFEWDINNAIKKGETALIYLKF